jgi:hypothetical protein
MNDRRTLFHRRLPLAVDVADAIDNLVRSDTVGLPLAVTIEEIATELVRIANIDDEGDPVVLSESTRAAVTDRFTNYLSTSSIFRAGYKTYEAETRNQVIPVTRFFFTAVYTDEARDCLHVLDDYVIRKSLPTRSSPLTDREGNPLVFEDDEDADSRRSGKTAGIAVFPQDHLVEGFAPKLVGVWLQRSASITIGLNEATATRLENAASASPMIAPLRSSVQANKSNLIAALPKPKM